MLNPDAMIEEAEKEDLIFPDVDLVPPFYCIHTIHTRNELSILDFSNPLIPP